MIACEEIMEIAEKLDGRRLDELMVRTVKELIIRAKEK